MQGILEVPAKMFGCLAVCLTAPIIYLVCSKEAYPGGFLQVFLEGYSALSFGDWEEYFERYGL